MGQGASLNKREYLMHGIKRIPQKFPQTLLDKKKQIKIKKELDTMEDMSDYKNPEQKINETSQLSEKTK